MTPIFRNIAVLIGLVLLLGPLLGNASGPEKNFSVGWGFLENQGQWPEDALFRGNASGFAVKFQQDGVLFLSTRESESNETEATDSEEHEEPVTEAEEEHEEKYEQYVWKLKFGGGNPKPEVTKGKVVAARTNFFLGNDSSKWRTNVPEYDELIYRAVWEGIDVRFFLEENGALKYEFLLAPGADPDDIRIEFEGLDGIEILDSGEMRLDHPWGPVTEDVPVAFAESDRRDVPVKFVKTGKTEYGFEVDEIPQGESWVIDPLILYWSSFANTSLPGSNYALDVSYDQTGHLYMTGRTTSGFPSTTGAYQTVYGGSVWDAFVAKFTPDGSNLAFMTYLGGMGLEDAKSISVAQNGRIFICGQSSSSNFPVTAGAISAGNGSGYAPWAACLNSGGSNLIYSTFFGLGVRGDARGLALVSGNEIILTGQTLSTGAAFPTSPGAFQSINSGNYTGFVCRLNATGSGLLWSTLLGGTGNDVMYDVAVNDLEEPYVVGFSTSLNYPVTPGAWHETPVLRTVLTRLNSTGTALIYSTWFAPNGTLEAITVHPTTREAYIAGATSPTSTGPFSATVGAFQTVPGGSQDAVVARFNAAGTAPVYITYLGGGAVDRAMGISIKNNGEAFVSGYTSSVNFPTTSCQFQPNHGGVYDAFLAHLSPLGDSPGYAGISYWGGSSSDYFNPKVEVRESAAGDTLFCCLTTHSVDFPVTPGAFQTVKLNGTSDIQAAFKLVPLSPVVPDTFDCGLDSVEVRIPSQVSNILWSNGATTPTTWINQSGQHWVSWTLYNCTYSDTFYVGLSLQTTTLGPDTTMCAAGPFALNLNPGTGNSWLWSTSATTPSITATAPGTYWVTTVDTVSGCTGSDTIVVTQTIPPVVNLSSGPVCAGDSVLLDADPANNYPGATYLWSNNATTQQSHFPGGILAWVELNFGGCTTRDSIALLISPLPIVNLGLDTTLCDTSVFTADAGPGFAAYLWSNNATTQSTTFTQSGPIWVEVSDANGCTNRDSLHLTLAQQPPPNLGPDQSICTGSSLSLHADPTNQYPGASFLWHNNATTPQITITSGGPVWVQITTAAGCILSDSLLVTLNPLPPVNIGPDITLCDTNVFTADAGPGFAAYLWSNNAITQTTNFTQPGPIWVQVTDANGCQNRDSMVLNFGAHPQPDLGADTTLCEGSSITLVPLGNGIGYSFDWSNSSTAAGITVNQSGLYTVIATELSSGCVGEDSILITVVPGPVPVLPADTLVCDVAVFDLNPGSFDSYDWSEGSSSATLSITESGNYAVTVTDGNGCAGSTQTHIRFLSTPQPDLGPDLELCLEERFSLSIPRVPGNLMQWSDGSAGNSLIVDESGSYWVEVSNECGRNVDTIQVVFLRENSGPFLPTAFHPGGEIPENEVFKATGEQVEDFQLTVYDRWGALIYQTRTIQDGWDGTIDGINAPEGVYVYVMQLRACDGQLVSRRGTVTLLR